MSRLLQIMIITTNHQSNVYSIESDGFYMKQYC